MQPKHTTNATSSVESRTPIQPVKNYYDCTEATVAAATVTESDTASCNSNSNTNTSYCSSRSISYTITLCSIGAIVVILTIYGSQTTLKSVQDTQNLSHTQQLEYSVADFSRRVNDPSLQRHEHIQLRRDIMTEFRRHISHAASHPHGMFLSQYFPLPLPSLSLSLSLSLCLFSSS
jgi:hypothetical protein